MARMARKPEKTANAVSFAPQVRDGARAQADTMARRHSGRGV